MVKGRMLMDNKAREDNRISAYSGSKQGSMMTADHVTRAQGSAGRPSVTPGTCILVCAGDFTPMDLDRDPARGDIIVAVDNGLTYLQDMGVMPDYILGDFDSLLPRTQETLREFRENAPERIVPLPVEKDDTDTVAALKFGLAKGYRKFRIYGALGGRMDHTMANLQTLVYAKHHGAEAYLLDDKQLLFVLEGPETKQFHPGTKGMFSIFALGDAVEGVTLRGMYYPLENGRITNDFPIGVSNEIIAPDSPSVRLHPAIAEQIAPEGASVSIEKGTALVIFTYEVEQKTSDLSTPTGEV